MDSGIVVVVLGCCCWQWCSTCMMDDKGMGDVAATNDDGDAQPWMNMKAVFVDHTMIRLSCQFTFPFKPFIDRHAIFFLT